MTVPAGERREAMEAAYAVGGRSALEAFLEVDAPEECPVCGGNGELFGGAFIGPEPPICPCCIGRGMLVRRRARVNDMKTYIYAISPTEAAAVRLR